MSAPPCHARGVTAAVDAAFDASTYYPTVASVIPTLLLAAAIEHHWLSPDTEPTADDVKRNWLSYVSTAFLTIFAVAGTLAAFLVLAGDPPPQARTVTFLGLAAAAILVLTPLAIRALLTPLRPWPRAENIVGKAVLPGALLVAALVLVLG